VSLTFDDGLASVYSLAFPEMERFHVPGTVFVISDLIGGEYLGHRVMTEHMLSNLCSAGWEIGSHTRSHPRLTYLPLERLSEELEASKQRLQSAVGKAVISLAYPHGEFDNRVVRCAAQHYSWGRGVSRYPPLRLNSDPSSLEDKMRLKALSCCKPAFTLPLQLYETYAPRAAKNRVHRLLHVKARDFPRNNDNVRNLDANIVKKWIQKSRNAWLILALHDIALEGESPPYSIALTEFRQIIRVIATGAEVIILGSACQDARRR
jgi:peptidoglycan/xylan/chitin deacetylase (PgdA/CDA1 family)